MFQLRFMLLSALLVAGAHAFACDDGFAAFQNTVYKKVRKDCALCHDGSVKNAPPFATEDMAASYEMILSYMNFSAIDESLLVVRGGNGHCGKPNCNKASGAEVNKAADTWWKTGELKCERNGKYFSAAMPLPANLPAKGKGFYTLTFDLGGIKNTLAGIAFQIDVQDYIPESVVTYGAYLFRNPRFVGGKKSIAIKDIKVLLNGKYDIIYNAYTSVNRSVPFFNVGSMATPTLSAENMIVLKDGLANPKIMISFVGIDASTDSANCIETAGFNQYMKPAMTANCAGCHTNASVTMPERMLDLTMMDEKLCQMSSAFVDPNRMIVSPLVDVPARGLNGHPALAEEKRYEFLQAYKAWLKQ